MKEKNVIRGEKTGKDMQKDTWLTSFNSVAINPDGLNEPVHVDVGLYDTMHDLFVNFIGAVVFSALGLMYIKARGKGFAAKFIPTLRKKEEK